MKMKTKTYLAATVVGLSLMGGCSSMSFFNTDPSMRDNNVGFELAKKGQYAAAESHFRQALDANPNNAFALTNMAYVYELQGRLGESKALYQKVLVITRANVKPTEEVGGVNRGSVETETESLRDIAHRNLASMTFVAPTTIAAAR